MDTHDFADKVEQMRQVGRALGHYRGGKAPPGTYVGHCGCFECARSCDVCMRIWRTFKEAQNGDSTTHSSP